MSFIAKYDGRCAAECGNRIHPGDEVEFVELEAFVGPRPAGHEGCHGDGDKTNNRLTNLRWDTSSENSFDVVRHGRNHNAAKTRCIRGHKLEGANLESRRPGIRACRACHWASTYATQYGVPFDEKRADENYRRIMKEAA